MNLKENKKEFIVFCEEKYGLEGNTHQHILDALSIKSVVYFIGPILSFKINNIFKKSKLTKLDDNLFEFKYQNFIPNMFQRSFIGKITSKINDFINEKRFIKESGKVKRDIIYFDPTKGISFHGNKKYYYVLDPYFNRPFDKLFAQKSNEVIVVNSEMIEKYISVKEKIRVVPHGIPTVSVNKQESDFIKNKYGSFALLMGTISDFIDFELLMKLVNSYSDTNFVMIGKITSMTESNEDTFATILKRGNVFYDGLIQYKKLDNYISSSNIGLIIYDSDMIKYRNPIKITNYLAHHKLILNTFNLVDLKPLESKILFTANNHNEFINLFAKAINNELSVDEKFVYEYSFRNDYRNIVDKIFLNNEK